MFKWFLDDRKINMSHPQNITRILYNFCDGWFYFKITQKQQKNKMILRKCWERKQTYILELLMKRNNHKLLYNILIWMKSKFIRKSNFYNHVDVVQLLSYIIIFRCPFESYALTDHRRHNTRPNNNLELSAAVQWYYASSIY